jgi:hypothetical protein
MKKMQRGLFVRNYALIILMCSTFINIKVEAQTAESNSTFHCISLYWKPDDASAENECEVKYRIAGKDSLKQGMSLWFDPNEHEGLPERSHEYRGSLVDLVPDTNYEIQLKLEKTGTTTTLFQKTLSEYFNVFKTFKLAPGEHNKPLFITEGGSKTEGYIVYDATSSGHIIDVGKQHDQCVKIDASYVILRGLTLKGAKHHGIELGNVDHVIIENCDISGWGSEYQEGLWKGFGINLESAVFSASNVTTSNIIIQRNKFHHPDVDANSWEEPVPRTHPRGPQGISLKNTTGNNIIRYNEIYSDKDHKYNDGMGCFGNFSFVGFPNRDSDIYCNKVSDCWDDAIEAEGSGMNVRIWGNFVDTTYMGFGLASQSLGPLYVFRNVVNFTQRAPYPINKFHHGGSFFKIGCEEENYKYAKGKIFIFHNTSLQHSGPWPSMSETGGVTDGLAYSTSGKVQDNIFLRNNILHVRASGNSSIRDHRHNPTNSFDYDLYNGTVRAAPGNEANGIHGIPVYDESNDTDEYFPSGSTSGHDDGTIIPNFNCGFGGEGPDRGAFEKGLPPVTFGINADWNEWVKAVNKVAYPSN